MDKPVRVPRAVAFWLLLAAVAIVVGALRESLLRPMMGEPWSQRIGTLAVCAIFVLLVGRFVRRLDPPAGTSELWLFGGMWLTFTSGGDEGQSTQARGEHFVIGRDDECDLVVSDERASRHHAYLKVHDDGRAELHDMGSANGTYVNGHRITGPVMLSGGEQIQVGNTTLSTALRVPFEGATTIGITPADLATPEGLAGRRATINGTPAKCRAQYVSRQASTRSGLPNQSRPNRTCAGPCFSQAGRSSRSANRFAHQGCIRAQAL